jgi:heterodisulfide reductase subunit D
VTGAAISAEAYLAGEASALSDACTRCGRCVEVCPVVAFNPAIEGVPAAVAGSVAAFLADGTPMSEAASAWTASCNGCGECIPACPEAVNPRRMLSLAATREAAVSSKTPELFRRMSRAIKVMLAMQLVPDEFAKLFVPPKPREASVVFYLGCNALRTPHLLFNAMMVLDALGVDYEAVGGPSSCCGVIATKWQGQVATGARVTANTISRFAGFAPDKVLNWCPTCQLHLGETLSVAHETDFSFDHLSTYLVSRRDELVRLFNRRINRRIVLHTHVGCAEVGDAVAKLLSAIPGLELLETVAESGYTCGGSGCSKSPALAARQHAELLQRVHATRADTLVTLYHGCHASFVGEEKHGAFEVLNFTDLLAEAIGVVPHRDMLKTYRLADDWGMIAEQAMPYLRANGMTISADWLKAHGPEIFASAEFKGGLACFGAGTDRDAS